MNDTYLALRDKAAKSKLLLNLHMDVTERCNLDCLHCYQSRHQAPGLTTSDYLGLLDQAAELGTLFLLVSGGEPLLRPDLFTILDHARKLRFSTTLSTNATLVDEAEAEHLAALNPFEVGVSVYSADPEVHDRITRIPGSLAATLRGIRLLRAAGLKVRLKLMVMAENQGRWQGVPGLARELGCSLSMDPTVFARDDQDSGHVQARRVPFEEKVAAYEAHLRSLTHIGESPRPPVPDPASSPMCGAGLFSLYVASSGIAYPCVTWRAPVGDLTAEPLRLVWERVTSSPGIAELRRGQMRGCRGCPYYSTCSPCPGIQHQLANNPLLPVDLVCERTRAWAEAMEHLGVGHAPIPRACDY